MTSHVVQPMPSVLDKIQKSLQTPVNTIFDQLAQQLAASLAAPADAPAPAAAEKAAAPAPATKDSSAALDFVKQAAPAASKPADNKPLRLTGISQEATDEYNRKLAQLKQHFFTELNHSFQQALQRQSRRLGQALAELQLVSHDELEFQLVLSHVESSLLDNFRHPLTLATLRLEHLLKRELNLGQVPIGPVALGRAFLAAIEPLQLEREQKKNILLALLLNLKRYYGSMLDSANRLLIEHNILPDLTEDDSRSRERAEKTRQEARDKRKKMLGVSEDSDDEQQISAEIAGFISQLKIPESASQHVIQSKAGAPRISKQELAARVDLIRAMPVTGDDGVYRKLDDTAPLAQQLGDKAQLQEYGLNPQAANTISVMSMVFENLLGNAHVPNEIKALLTQLQAPLLKAAVQDELFFGDTDNPAQKLFNSIAEASVSWSPEKNPEHDFLYKKMSAVVDKVSNDFDDDYLIFDEAIEDFFTFKESEEKKTSQLENRIVDRETAQARLHTAREKAGKHIQKKFGHLRLPDAVRQFIDTTWQQALFFIYNKENDKNSVAWQDAMEIENSLLANLRSKEQEDVEVFMIVLEEKLADAGIEASEIERQLQAIESALGAGHDNIGEDLADEDDSDNEDAARQAEEDALLKDIQIGSWLRKLDSDPPIKVKVAAHIKFNDTWVLVLRNGMKEGTYTSQQLLELIRNGKLEVVSNTLLFDSALESVISDMR